MVSALLARPPRVPSLVFGMSGTKLDDPLQAKLVGETLDGAEVVTADTRDKFGYALAEPDADGWKLTVYSVKGNPKVECKVAGESLTCEGKEWAINPPIPGRPNRSRLEYPSQATTESPEGGILLAPVVRPG